MSIKVMSRIWDKDIGTADKLILLALADWADDEGGRVYPSLGLVAHKTGFSHRYIREKISEYVSQGWLFRVSWSDLGTYLYRFNLEAIPNKEAYDKRISNNAPIRRKGQPVPLPN